MDLREQLQRTLGKAYVLEDELGGGAMSRVFIATESALGRKVVVKVLPPEMAASVRADRFRREIQLAANLQHPHIVPLLSAGETDGLPYFVMPFVPGETLRDCLSRERELPVEDTVRILREVASALAYAHENGIVHRDIKPANVLVSGGAAVVTDFGVAKALTSATIAGVAAMTSTGITMGTPAYMAPEQATADPLTDHRADIYALGVMGYEMLAGSLPFASTSAQGIIAAHLTQTPESVARRRPSTPPALAQLIMRCLEKRPADRFQTAAELVRRLDSVQAAYSDGTSFDSQPFRASIETIRHLASWKQIGSVSLAIAALVSVIWVTSRRPPQPTDKPDNAFNASYGQAGPMSARFMPSPATANKILGVLDAYSRAIESRDVVAIQKIYPGMTEEQQERWRTFFQSTRSIRVSLRTANMSGTERSVEAQVIGEYVFVPLEGRTENVPVSFFATIRDVDGKWQIVAVREPA